MKIVPQVVQFCALPPLPCCPVQISIAGLNQPGKNEGAIRAVEVVQRREAAAGGDLENRAAAEGTGLGVATRRCRAIEVSIAGLHQLSLGRRAIGADEAVQRGQTAVQGHLEDRAVEEAGAAASRCPVQVAVRALHQAAKRAATVMAGAKRAKVVDRGEGAAGGDSEERATMVAALGGGGAIEVAVAGQQQSAVVVRRHRFP